MTTTTVYLVPGAGTADQAIEWVSDEFVSATHSIVGVTPFGTPHDAESNPIEPGFCLCGMSMTKAIAGTHA